MKALVILSGGQDSSTSLFWAVQEYGPDQVAAITFDYGQRHLREIQAARVVAQMSGINPNAHELCVLGDILKGTSPLTNPAEPLEQYADFDTMDKIIGTRVEKTFVPMRNALFLTIAANRAAVMGANTLVTGVCQNDNANYPDCRAAFIGAQEFAINEALGFAERSESQRMSIVAPLMYMSKSESIRLAITIPGAYSALAYTHTAYDGQYPPTGSDHATVLRAEGFLQLNLPDPLILRAYKEGLMTLPESPNYIRSVVNASLHHIRLDFAALRKDYTGHLLPPRSPEWLR